MSRKYYHFMSSAEVPMAGRKTEDGKFHAIFATSSISEPVQYYKKFRSRIPA